MKPDHPPHDHSWRLAWVALGLFAVALAAVIIWLVLGGLESNAGSGY